MVTQSVAGARDPEFNSPVARPHLRFNSRASTLAGEQCWLYAVRSKKTTCDRIMQCDDTSMFGA